MVLISVQSVEEGNGYEFKNDFAESLIIDPKSRVSVVNIQFKRKADFVILSAGNAFQVQIGGSQRAKDTIEIAEGTYTAPLLCEEIQNKLNTRYQNKGHFFEVDYDFKDKRFEIKDNFSDVSLPSNRILSYDNKNLNFVENADVVSVSESGEIDLSFINGGTANYLTSSTRLETGILPKFEQDGSNIIFNITHTSAVIFPPVVVGNNSDGETLVNLGFMVGFQTDDPTGQFLKGVGSAGASKIVNTIDNYTVALIFYSDTSASGKLKIVEKGQAIGDDVAFEVEIGDEYRIILSEDGLDGSGHPVYQYRRQGQTIFENFNISGSHQTLVGNDIIGTKLHPIIASDVAGLKVVAQMTVSGQEGLLPLAITAGDNGKRLKDHELATSFFQRTVAGAQAGRNTVGQGFITQELSGEGCSKLQFKLPTTTKADFYVSVLDETKRKANQTAEGNDENDMGIADPAWGNTAQANGSAQPAGNFNPALVAFRFKTWDGDSAYNQVANNKIYYRKGQNAFTTVNSNPDAIEEKWVEVATYDWVANPNSYFQVNVIGSGNYVDLVVSPSGDLTDNTTLARLPLPATDFTGIKTVDNIVNQVDFTASSTINLLLTDGALTAQAEGTTNGSGELTAITITVPGVGFTNGETVAITELDVSTNSRVGNGAGTADINAMIDYDNTTGMKTSGGYCYWFALGNPEVGSATESFVKELTLLSTQDSQKEYNIAFFPRFESLLGDCLGFKKNQYVLKDNGDLIISDDNPKPNQQVDTEPTVMLNLDNLPVKSYIGKRFKADALITDKPVGNTQGLTRMVAKIPRFHDDQGDGGASGVGPYHYDYFPYSVPLHNATELVLNELEISLKNPDGTLATDITESHILLQLTNVDSVGEGNSNRGGVGAPKMAPMSYDRLDITKGQLEPSIRGGFAQGDGGDNIARTVAPDQWGHANLNANKSHAL